MLWVNFFPSPSSFQIYFQQKTHVTGVYMVDTLTVFWDVASCVNLCYIIRSNLGDHYFNDTVRLFLTENQAYIITVFLNSEWCLHWHRRGPPQTPRRGDMCRGVLFRAGFCFPDRRQYSAFLVWNLGESSLKSTGWPWMVMFYTTEVWICIFL